MNNSTASALRNLEMELAEEGIHYSPAELVSIRRESVLADLADGYDSVCVKVPSGSEVMIPAALARELL